MGKAWQIAKSLLGLRLCTWSAAVEDADDFFSDEADSAAAHSCPNTPGRFSSRKSPQISRNSLRSVSKGTCSICLEAMKSGAGQAVFTAECSHAFHFACISSNVKHGNMICPVCRAQWKEVPWNGSSTPPTKQSRSPFQRSPLQQQQRHPGTSPLRSFNSIQIDDLDDPVIRIIDESIANAQGNNRSTSSSPRPAEPLVYDDDEIPPSGESSPQRSSSAGDVDDQIGDFELQLDAHAEVGSVSFFEQRNSFNVLIHVKAPASQIDPSQRAPIDLVTVLDVSGSMAGTKLILLKRAMSFVIRNLSSRDRLSVVVFSSSAKRLFPLKAMAEEGRQFALRLIDTLVCTGGTNIAEGLRKGGKVLEDRRNFKNPVASIMLLSDGQDTYSMGIAARSPRRSSQGLSSESHKQMIISNQFSNNRFNAPVHTFGFGADHDAPTMHSIAERSGGTFSFIQAEGGVQDAFAQCVGGLLSVVAQDVQLRVSTCSESGTLIRSVHAGSYMSWVTEDSTQGSVRLGDLYADEERDILVELQLPSLASKAEECFILDVGCTYTDTVHHGVRTGSRKLAICRPGFVSASQQTVSADVDRQKNRLVAARAITEAGVLAEAGEIEAAQRVLRSGQVAIQGSVAAQAGDKLSGALDGELGEIQLRIGNRQLYERSGRAYILSAQSSHWSQRATTRGHYNSMEDYQTPSMTGMILRSQQHSRS